MKQDKNLLQNGADAFKKGDFSMLGGVQLKLSAIRITGRYAIGLNNINDIDNKDQWKSQGFQVIIGSGTIKSQLFYRYCPPDYREGFFLPLWQVFPGGMKLDNYSSLMYF